MDVDGSPVVVYPDAFAEKVLGIEARGGSPAALCVVLPTTVVAGETFAGRIAVTDADGLPSFEVSGEAVLRPENGNGEIQVRFGAGRPACCRVEGLRAGDSGYIRYRAEFAGLTTDSNPAAVSAAGAPRIFWGDPHIHTVLSDCHPERCRTRNLAYVGARDVSLLDWVAIADHVSNGPRGTRGKWLDNIRAADLFDDPGRFATVPAYEASLEGGKGGDNNVYLREFPPMYSDPWKEGLTIRELCDRLPADAIVVPHHTTRTGKHGEIPAGIYPGPDRMPLVEICSKWGASEYPGNPGPLREVHPGPSTVRDLLAQGYRLGFVGGSDTHTSLTFCRNLEPSHISRPTGLTAVLAGENRREAIWDALRQRACYAASGERIFLDTEVNGLAMGGSRSAENRDAVRRVRVRCAAAGAIERIDVVCNGDDVASATPCDREADMVLADGAPLRDRARIPVTGGAPFVTCYVRVTTASGARAWSSPVRFEMAD